MLFRFVVCIAITFSTTLAFAAPSNSGLPGDVRSKELNEKGVASMRVRDFKEAVKLLEGAVSLDPGNLSAAYNLAGAYVSLKREQDAIDLLEEVLDNHKKDPGIYARLGDAYFSLGNANKAKVNYESAQKLDPNYSDIYQKLGTIYGLLQLTKESEASFLKAVEQNPEDAENLSALSAMYLANNKPQDSIRAAKKAIQHKVLPGTYKTLGAAYEQLGDKQNALIAYKKAQSLGDNSKDLIAKITQLK